MENKSIAGQIAASYLEYSKQAINKGEEPISLAEYVKKITPVVKDFLDTNKRVVPDKPSNRINSSEL